ncbi:hypothetical protein ABBQ38_001195 [Trebouxia sp. C0009 RCD-2024]
MNGSASVEAGLSLAKLGLEPAAEDMTEIVDEEPDASLMDEDYAEEDGDDELEEAWSEEDERPTQYDLRQYGVYQSLPIPAGPPDLQSDCTTAEEYIKRVRYEAEQLPQTVTSCIDPRDFDAQRTDYIPLQDQDSVTAADCIPSRQWLTEFLADFASLRAQIHREEEDFDPFLPRPPPPPPPHPLPHSRDKNGWQRYCLGAPQPQQQQQQQQQQPNTVADADAPALSLDQDGSASDVHTTAEGSTHAATHQTPNTAEAMLAEPLLGMNGHTPETEASSISADAAESMPAESMPGLEGVTEDVETSSMSAEPEVEPGTLGDTEAASAGGHPPQMAVLASLDQVTVNYLLQWHVNWAVMSASIPELSMRWLYALMAQVEKPVTIESSSQLSKLLRHCMAVRKTISDDNDMRLLSIHMLIALAGGYFGQDGTLAACMQPAWI